MSEQERRRYSRFETDVKIKFHVNFDLKTRVDVRVQEQKRKPLGERFSAVSQNVSAEGISFSSDRSLDKDDDVVLEVYVPSSPEPVEMTGTVRWCRPSEDKKAGRFTIGVRLTTVRGEDVINSIIYDEVHKIYWSIVLESIFSHFKNLALRRPRAS